MLFHNIVFCLQLQFMHSILASFLNTNYCGTALILIQSTRLSLYLLIKLNLFETIASQMLSVVKYTLLFAGLSLVEVSHRITCSHPLHHGHFVTVILGRRIAQHHELFV